MAEQSGDTKNSTQAPEDGRVARLEADIERMKYRVGILEEALLKNSFVVMFFNAEFTEQEQLVKSAVEALSRSLKDKIEISLVDVEKDTELAEKYSVLSVPMVVCLAKGKVVAKIDTIEPTKLVKTVEEELKRHAFLTESPAVSEKDYLKQLTNRAPVMIFMKGDPKQPRCGFSKQLVELLSKHSIKYDSFDILQDEDVRQGLKEYSDWPTYPQIYVKGEFIGGLDILKQMDEQGELAKALTPTS